MAKQGDGWLSREMGGLVGRYKIQIQIIYFLHFHYDTMHKTITIINNKVQIKVFMPSVTEEPFSLGVFGWSSAMGG